MTVPSAWNPNPSISYGIGAYLSLGVCLGLPMISTRSSYCSSLDLPRTPCRMMVMESHGMDFRSEQFSATQRGAWTVKFQEVPAYQSGCKNQTFEALVSPIAALKTRATVRCLCYKSVRRHVVNPGPDLRGIGWNAFRGRFECQAVPAPSHAAEDEAVAPRPDRSYAPLLNQHFFFLHSSVEQCMMKDNTIRHSLQHGRRG